MNFRTRTVAVTATAALATALSAHVPANAVDHSQGTPGFCPTDVGVTVVIDFGELGGDPLVRCNPTSTAGSGLDALRGAGIQITGVQRWGESFVCRIENKPASTQRLTIPGDDNYREACIDTPPAEAYWSYWHAGNNCAWTYSQWGVKNRDFIQGGFEGWTFSLGQSAEESARGAGPRIPAVRPGTEGAACGATVEPSPTTGDQDEKASRSSTPTPRAGGASPTTTSTPHGTSTPGTTSGNTARTSRPTQDATQGSQVPGALPRSASPQSAVVFTGGEDAPDLSVEADRDRWRSGLLVGVLALLLAGVWHTRRRRAGGAR